MTEEPERTHSLDGFPAAAVKFVVALQRNRENIAIQHGLSASELRALFWIAERGSVRPKELAAHMEMTTGGITAISSRLADMNLLERVAHPDDRRSLYLKLSTAGHSMMSQMHRDFIGMVESSASMLDGDQLAEFEWALDAVADEVSRRTDH